MHLLDHFYFYGPHGTHLCLVSEVLGESIRRLSLKYNRNFLPIPFVKQITKQVLTGLDYLHSHDIIHTGIISCSISRIVTEVLSNRYEDR